MPAVTNTPIFNKIRTKLGVKPAGLAPYNKPSTVADAILYVAEHPTRDFVVGDVGRVLEMMQRVCGAPRTEACPIAQPRVRFPQSVRLGSLRLKREALRKPLVKKQIWQYAGDRILPGFVLNTSKVC